MLGIRYHYYPRFYRRGKRPRKTTYPASSSEQQSVWLGGEWREKRTTQRARDKEAVFPVRHGQCQGAGQSTVSAVASGWAGGDPAMWRGALPWYKKHMQR